MARVLRYTMAKSRRRHVNTDTREIPLFSIAEASFCLRIPATTIRQWIWGRPFETKDGRTKFSAPIMSAADTKHGLLSFVNLAEAHVLQATRDHGIPMDAVRDALTYVEKQTGSPHPLVTEDFYVHGKGLFIKRLSEILNASKHGQIAFDWLDECLERLVRDSDGLPYRLFPLRLNPERRVMVDLNIGSAQPVVTGTGILAEVLHGRFHSGESFSELAKDYGVDERSIEHAVRYIDAAA